MFILKTPAASVLPLTRILHRNLLPPNWSVFNLFSSRLHLVMAIVVAGLFSSGRVQAQPSRPIPDPARSARAEAAQLNQLAEQISQSDHSQLSARANKVAEDLAVAYRNVAAAYLKVAEAYENGSAATIADARKELKRVEAAQERVRELSTAVSNVERYNSSLQAEITMTVEAARPQLDAYLNSRNAAANAAAALAHALESEANSQTLTVARDEWLTAYRNVELHNNAWSRANHVGYFGDKAAKEKDAARLATFNTLKQLDAEILKLSLEDSEVKTKMLKVERRRQKAEAAVSDLLGAKKK